MRRYFNVNDFISGIQKYPSELLDGRKTTEGNVIVCIYKDPLLLKDSNLYTTDFITLDGSFYFALARQLAEKGFTAFDEVTLLSKYNGGSPKRV